MIYRSRAHLGLIALLMFSGCPDPTTTDDDHHDDDDAIQDDDSAAGDDDDSATTDDDSASDTDQDNDGWSSAEGDCDDTDPAVNPDAAEVHCDGVDNDCDGSGSIFAMAVVDGLEFQAFASAVAAIQDGSTLSICPGTHTEQLHIAPLQANLAITSLSGTSEDTILDGQGLHTVLYLGDDLSVTVSHLTIRNGLGEAWIGGDYAGGGIMSFADRLELSDCTFEDNGVDEPGGCGGAVTHYVSSSDDPGSEVVVSACRFTSNTASGDGGEGGAVCTKGHQDYSVSVEASTFDDNQVFLNGGALYIRGDTGPSDAAVTLEVSDSTFSGNQAEQGDGGSIDLSFYRSMAISQCTFEDSSAGYEGGAVILSHARSTPAPIDITDTTFQGNAAAGGGALLLNTYTGSEILQPCLHGVTFSDNTSGYYGGAVTMGGSGRFEATLTDTHFLDNVAIANGGAIYAATGGDVTLSMDGGSLSGNQGGSAGGAMALMPLTVGYPAYDVALAGVEVDSNACTGGDWGAFWVLDDTTLTLDGCTVTSNTGGAALIDDDSGATLHSIDSDWGTGATDNTPWDTGVLNGPTYAWGANATFTCTWEGTCF